jgi:hypothetical protein
MSDLVSNLPKVLSVFAMAFIYFWASIPAGFALGLGPVLVAVTAWLSYTAGVGLILVIGKPIVDWLMKRFGSKLNANANSLFWRAWDRFGLVGLSLLGPITIGAQTSAALGLTLGVPPRKLLFGLALGAAVWAVVITGAVLLGVMGASNLR